MSVFEKAKATITENLISREEMFYGIAFLYYSEIIDRAEYKELMNVYNNLEV